MSRITVENVVELLGGMELEIDPVSLDPEVPLAQQGVDSLDMMNILFEFEDRYSIKIDEDTDVSKWATVVMMVENINDMIQDS